MTFKSYAMALVRSWVRGIREALQEEKEIEEIERREGFGRGIRGMWL